MHLFFYIFFPSKKNVFTNFIPQYLGYVIDLRRVLIRKEKKIYKGGKLGLARNFGGRNIFYFLKNETMELLLVIITKLQLEE